MKRFALDTESEYSDEISLVTMGPWHYVRATNNYLLTVAGEDGYQYVGSPKDFDWSILEGAEVALANAPYDLTVLEWLNEKGDIKLPKFSSVDVLDLARYLGRPGSLKGASESLLGIEMSKETRNNMKGKKWDTMTPEFKQEVMDYALKDAKLTLQLWLEHGDKWPWYERELSRQTREMCMRGLPVDVEEAHKAVRTLKRVCWDAEQKIPWSDGGDAKTLSPKSLAEECRKVGITPPKSLAQDSPECAAWEDKYGEQFPWVDAMRTWRKANTLLKKVETLVSRIRPDGTFPFGLKYFGSSLTGRWSGDAGFSVLNMPRGEMFGVDLRGLFKAPEGYKFLIYDFSSLEPRVANWIVGNWEMLELMRDPSTDIYEAHARASMGYKDPRKLKDYDKEEGKEVRKLAKARVLGAGYGASGAKFVTIAKTMAVLDLSLQEATKAIDDFRRQNKNIVDCWGKLQRQLKLTAGRGNLDVELPGGRTMTYWSVSNVGGELTAVTCRNGKMMRTRWWGSKVFENLIQGSARQVLAEKLLQLELEHNLPPCLHVHDEIVVLVPENETEEKAKLMEKVMSEEPSFMPGLPLAAEGYITERYTK